MQKSVLEPVNRNHMFSLEKLSLRKVTTMLSNNQNLLCLITKSLLHPGEGQIFCTIIEKEWTAIQAMAKQLLSEVCISISLKEKIMELLWPVSYKIMMWIYKYARFIKKEFLCHFYWTDQGRIDSTRTGKSILRKKDIPIVIRFPLACALCLGREIREMWEELSMDEKRYFFKTDKRLDRRLPLFWAHNVAGEKDCKNYRRHALECAVQKRYMEAVEYLYIRSKDITDSFLDIFINCFKNYCCLFEEDIDIGYFLFFEMNPECQDAFFKNCPVLVLALLFYSSEYELFLKLLAERVQPDLDVFDIRALLLMILHEYHIGVKDYDFGILFIEVWETLTDDMRVFFANTEIGDQFFATLIWKNFPFLLEGKVPKDLPESFSSGIRATMTATPFGFHRSKWNFLLFLISEEIVTVTSLQQYKSLVVHVLMRHVNVNDRTWNRILRFVRKVKG